MNLSAVVLIISIIMYILARAGLSKKPETRFSVGELDRWISMEQRIQIPKVTALSKLLFDLKSIINGCPPLHAHSNHQSQETRGDSIQ